MNKMEICISCGGVKKESKFPLPFNYGDKNIVIRNIPGMECKRCGRKTMNMQVVTDGIKLLKDVLKGKTPFVRKDGVLYVDFPNYH